MSDVLRGIGGLIGWALAFSLLYGLHGLACEGLLGGVHARRTVLVGAWVGTVGALGALVWTERGGVRRDAPFLRRLALGSAVIGLVATIVTGSPAALLRACT